MELIFENEVSQRATFLKRILSELGFTSVRQFQLANGLTPDGIFGMKSYAVLYRKYLNVQDIDFEGAYHKTANLKKTQIVLHHSAGWDNSRGMFDYWRIDGINHVATAIGITDNGEITRGFDEAYWAYHIGTTLPNHLQLEQQSIGVEICNWGSLEERNGQLFTWVGDYGKRGRGVTIPYEKAIELNYKGYKYYEAYTDAEIEATRKWIMLMAIRFKIPIRYNATDFWAVSENATKGRAGLYTHNSFISWKSDISPQPKMIKMLESFNQ